MDEDEVEVISKEVKADTSDCAKKEEENTFTKTNTFNSPIKIDEIDNSLGNAMVRYKSTESNTPVVVGTSEKPMVLMGNGTRPTYSSSGSDFSGSELALKSDLDSAGSMGEISFSFTGTSSYKVNIIGSKDIIDSIKLKIRREASDYEGSEELLDLDTSINIIETHWSDSSGDASRFWVLRDIITDINTCFVSIVDSYSVYPCMISTAYYGKGEPMYGTYLFYLKPLRTGGSEAFSADDVTPDSFTLVNATWAYSSCATLKIIV